MAGCRYSFKRADRVIANIREGLPLSSAVASEGLTLADVEHWRAMKPKFREQFDQARAEALADLHRRMRTQANRSWEAASHFGMMLAQDDHLAYLREMTAEPIAA